MKEIVQTQKFLDKNYLSNEDSFKQNKPQNKGKWNKEEDEMLKSAIEKFGAKNWRNISNYVDGRTPIQCLHRWSKILQPGLIKGPWTVEEDRKLLAWIEKEGPTKWTACAEFIKGRSGKQCRERYFNSLNPSLKKGNWTPDEDYLLFRLYKDIGTKWSLITKYFPGRTENSIKKTDFYSSLRRIATKKRKDKKKSDLDFDTNSNLQDLIQFIPTAITEKTANYMMNKNSSEESKSYINDNGISKETKLIQDLKTNSKFHEYFNNNYENNSSNSNNNINNDDFLYDFYQQQDNIENKIDGFEFNLSNLDNQIDHFVDNYFNFNNCSNNNQFELEGKCCENIKNFDLNNSENNKSYVLLSLIEQINKLEKLVQKTKNELIFKKSNN